MRLEEGDAPDVSMDSTGVTLTIMAVEELGTVNHWRWTKRVMTVHQSLKMFSDSLLVYTDGS
jgi:hypothetical protein